MVVHFHWTSGLRGSCHLSSRVLLLLHPWSKSHDPDLSLPDVWSVLPDLTLHTCCVLIQSGLYQRSHYDLWCIMNYVQCYPGPTQGGFPNAVTMSFTVSWSRVTNSTLNPWVYLMSHINTKLLQAPFPHVRAITASKYLLQLCYTFSIS